jgi:lysophospholipase L1-like esterase
MFPTKAISSIVAMLFAATASAQTTAPSKIDLKYSFGSRPMAAHQKVTPTDAYATERGYGFDLGSKVESKDRFVTGKDNKPFFFSAKVPPGAYKVTVTLGDPAGISQTTVKSETRRLMLEGVKTASGQSQRYTFFCHVRIPEIPGGGTVALKDREKLPILYVQWDDNTRIPFLELNWDEKLTLAFSDAKPALQSVEITNAENPITIYLIGDSTMTDHFMEPFAAWGQMFPRFFKAPVMIANYAECGETTASFIGERRWPKLMSEISKGDYVLMQFGINDRSIPLDRFKQYFVQFIDETIAKGATPVLVTSQNLRRLDANGKASNTLGGYPDAMREVAKEKNVALIDLNAMSMPFYEALGPDKLPKAFIDGTHHSDYGAYELAKCVVNGVIENKLPWAQYLVEDWKTFDPARPDPLETFNMPTDPQLDPARPGGPGAPDGRGPMAGAIPAARRGGAATRPATQPGRNPQ